MSITGGSYTIGSGGNYADWSSFFSDIALYPTPVEFLATQVSDITETGTALLSGNFFQNGGLTLDGSGYVTTFDLEDEHGLVIKSKFGSNQNCVIKNMHIVADPTNTGSGYSMVHYSQNGGSLNPYSEFHDNIIDVSGTMYNGLFIEQWFPPETHWFLMDTIDNNVFVGGVSGLIDIAAIHTYYEGNAYVGLNLAGSGNTSDSFFWPIINRKTTDLNMINITFSSVTNSGIIPPVYIEPIASGYYNGREICFITGKNGKELNFLPNKSGKQVNFRRI